MPSTADLPPFADLTLAVLAGGRGSRMGVAKDRLLIDGRPILAHLLDRAGYAGSTLLVTSAARPQPLAAERFDRVAIDLIDDAGPLAGIATALAAATTPTVCVLSVDMPNVGAEQVGFLRGAMNAAGGDVLGLLCRRRDGSGVERIEPFPSVFRASAAALVAAELAAGRRSLCSLLDLPAIAAIDVPNSWPGSVWPNLNRPTDLEQIGATFC